MSLMLYAHPFSSYCQKVLVALYENDVEFEYRTLEDPGAMAELKARWPFARAVDEARPFRHYFPLGAPDRD
jgi:glutathione S-transferase